MSIYTEKGTVEDFFIQELPSLGWRYVAPEEMKLRRKENFEEPLVIEDLKSAVKKVNTNIEFTDEDLDFIIVTLRTIPANVDGIKRFLDIFRNGLLVPLKKERKEKVIKLVDLQNVENNDFVVTRQFRLEGSKGNIRADIILLVNGIPLVLIECKSPTAEEVSWLDAYRQIKGYEEKAPELFKYVQLSIATDGEKTFYFPNAYNPEGEDFLNQWKDPYPYTKEQLKTNKLKTTIYGLLSKQNLLDIIENFTFIRKERDKTTKITARYMQFRATNRIYQRVVNTLKGIENKKFGLIWHWLGAGKTYTMAFTAWKLHHCPEAKNPSIFVIVDRKELEEQIEKDFSFIEIPIEKVNTVKHLIELLKWGKEGKRGIFLVTIEKFRPKDFTELEKQGEKIEIARENVVVLADEVHRTHYGKFSTMMRSIFKNAFIFGFTGTPLSKAERNTFQKFCPTGELYLDRYSMIDSMEDGFTVPLSYQARLPEYHLKPEQLKDLIKYEEEEIEKLTPQERRELKQKVKVIKAYVKKPERIAKIAQDITQHFKEVVEPTELKALIVTIDREACTIYKNALDQLLPEAYTEIVMTAQPNDKQPIRSYFQKIQEKYQTKDIKQIHKTIIEKFLTQKEPKILIVTDMLITGFDAKQLWTMYLDKPLKEHRILQAIGRTNRPYQNKKFGLIIDYIGILKELEKAFQNFEATDERDIKIVIRDLTKEQQTFIETLNKALKIFENIKIEDTHESLENALNVLLSPQTAKNFEETMKELMKSYEMLRGEPFLKPYLAQYTLLTKIYIAYNRRYKKQNIDELKIENLSKKTVQLIQQTIDIKTIEDNYPILPIDDKYIERIKHEKPTTGAAIDILTNIQRQAKAHPTSPFFISISADVMKTYEELRNRKIQTEEAIQKALTICQKITEWQKEEEEIGKDKHPIYETIKALIPATEKQKIVNFATNLLNNLKQQKLLFEGWQKQREARRKIKMEIRVQLLSQLKEYKDKIDELTEKIFETLEAKT
uniref:Type I restriction enzyme endonuclease subunit n=1 Tax=candidate division WOR-3 bacterium TaxID=2052148 RepID=A0A7C2PKE6_UNCW3